MPEQILLQGKVYPWRVNELGVAFVGSKPMALRTAVVGDYTYIGLALPGTSETAASWRISRMFAPADGSVSVAWADGDGEFDNVWANRESLVYL